MHINLYVKLVCRVITNKNLRQVYPSAVSKTL